ncbi:MAG: hypothetical protein HUU38_11375 [Anaerolineales bacterium]|nr:hypothetical protein [Anaerolineales bacterium]
MHRRDAALDAREDDAVVATPVASERTAETRDDVGTGDEVDASGFVRAAQIVPPTSQNQGRIEDDLVAFMPTLRDASDDELTHRLEQLVRSYDPCISCATHFLDVEIEGTP